MTDGGASIKLRTAGRAIIEAARRATCVPMAFRLKHIEPQVTPSKRLSSHQLPQASAKILAAVSAWQKGLPRIGLLSALLRQASCSVRPAAPSGQLLRQARCSVRP